MDVIEKGEIRSEQLLENTAGEKSVHTERNENKVNISFDTSDNSWFEDVKKELAVHFNVAVDECLKDQDLVRLRELTGIKDSQEWKRARLGKESNEEYESCVNTVETPAFPKPGTFVPKELHEFLDNSYVLFESDFKFIALEIEDPAVREGTETGAGDELDPTYMFVEIIRKAESDLTHPLLQEYEIADGIENLRVVKSKLFKFVRSEVENNKEERVVINAGGTSDRDMNFAAQSSSLQSVFKDIRNCLVEAWNEPVVDRRNIVKRLLLNWHPDQNSDSVLVNTKVFHYLQQCICRLGKGMDLTGDNFDDSDSDFSRSAVEYWSNSWFGHFWERREKLRKSQERNNRSGTNDEFDGGWNARRSYFTTPEPQPYPYNAEARRWQKQAVFDIDNGISSLQRMPNNAFNWVCYMAHQAAEKSMKAAWYAKDANKIHGVRYSHNLSSIAYGLRPDIEKLARSLTSLTGEHTRMRYPDAFYGQQIPAEAFNRQTAETVVSVAKQIIDIVQRNYIR